MDTFFTEYLRWLLLNLCSSLYDLSTSSSLEEKVDYNFKVAFMFFLFSYFLFSFIFSQEKNPKIFLGFNKNF